MNDPRITDLLAALGAHVGIPDLEMNDDNVCRLVLDRSLVVDMEHLPGTNVLQVYSVVGGHPENNLALCHQLLAANLFGQGTGGAVLALDESRGEVLLVQTFDLSTVTPEVFVTTLESYVGYVSTWTEELLKAEGEDEPGDSDEGPDSGLPDASAFIRV